MNTNLLIDYKTQTSTFLDVLKYRVLSQPQQVAFTFLENGETESAQITYAELASRARSIAGCLQVHGIQPGDRALLLYPSSLEFIAAFLGCLYAGVIAVPTYTPQSKRHLPRLQAICTDAKASIVLTDRQILAERNRKFAYPPELEVIPWAATDTDQWTESFLNAEVTSETLAFLQYTSGSTSRPKGVMVSHSNILHNEKLIEKAFEHNSQTVFAGWLPLFHDMGLIGNVLQPIYLGIPCVLMPPVAFLQSPVRWLKAISKYGATTSGGPNFAYDLCVEKVSEAQKSELDLSTWSIAFNGAEPVRFNTLTKFANAFAQCGFRPESFYPCYGMAETTLIVSGSNKSAVPMVLSVNKSALTEGQVKLEENFAAQVFVTNGQPIPDLELVIVHPEKLTPCQPDQVGEIWVSGSSVAQGYWQRPIETKQTFRAYLQDRAVGPFLRTGDLGFLHDGELFFTGRFKDLIIIRGRNYYPQDIEFTVENSHRAVRPNCSAAFSIEMDETEQLVVVAEVDRHNDNHPEVIAAIRTEVANQHELAVYAVILLKTGSIPKTSSGKIQRHACRHQFLEKKLLIVADSYLKMPTTSQETSQSLTTPIALGDADSIRQWIERWLVIELKLPPSMIVPNKTFAEYGLDSVSAAELVVALEAELNHPLKLESHLFWEYPTVNVFSQYLSKLINQESADVTSSDSVLNNVQASTEGSSVVFIQSESESSSERNLSSYPSCPLPSQAFEEIPQILKRVTKQQNRQLFIDGRWICDFASCNYLGLDLHPQVQEAIAPAITKWGTHPSWSRAVASPDLYRILENALSNLVKAPDVLVFPALTLLHMGVIPMLAGKEGVIFIDNAAHRSVSEACRLAQQDGAKVIIYRHNDLDNLADKLKRYADAPVKLIAIDGVYSMSANYADLPSYVRLAKQYDATIYVDDAHGFGLVGENPTPEMPYGQFGNGIVNHFGLRYAEDRIVYCAGLSKAFSSFGAFVTCTDAQMKRMLSTAWTAIFSGPSPVASLASAIAGLEVNQQEGGMLRQHIYRLTQKLVISAREIGFEVDNQGSFPIVSVVVGSVESAITACKTLWKHGILITPGIFPAVPYNRSILRFSITAANTEIEIDRVLVALRDIHTQLSNELITAKN
ncbi:aminotransferase class I/II-fold pyridoxal phosphate-dependent enzyme [Nostoc sphaeroides CHAB 2801]|uniref:aminotransferase class I/II-fold pyridoxal phosphate-dependent enzyme n=1 Tax=Nostoc sphaeroides TaxID=446679 RepID=UPI001E4A0C47|nr:aminotransferase class I/II-fold pyridoxal phosphate-dependent enzyme [Nostoc sphaeroides]MCC5633715.1 aminotransferase class I/II-fold pyridoxal phosphate-dependent enzyme [Nostoc sphaeroides CHAB 2801]